MRDAETALNRLEDNLAKLKELIDQAERGEIHKALGCTYNAWLKDTLRIEVSDRPERKVFALMMSDKGMSTRTIADILGVGKSTVDHDLATVPRGTPDGKVTGMDGKKHPAKKPAAQLEPAIDAEVVPLPDDKPKIPPLTEEFRNEVYVLKNCVTALKDIVADERFPKLVSRFEKLDATPDFEDAVIYLETFRKAIIGLLRFRPVRQAAMTTDDR